MKEYGAVDSWTKLATIGEQTRGNLEMLGFVNNDEILIEFESGCLGSHSLESYLVTNLVYYLDKKPFYYLYNYVPSLHLLNKGNNGGAMELVIKDIQSKLKLWLVL